MSIRTLLLLIVAVPALLLGGAFALGQKIPIPEWGRDYVLSFLVNQDAPDFRLPEVQGPSDPTRPLVVIDAGHGGRDYGAVGEDIREKDVVLSIASTVRDILIDAGGIRVAMTRDGDDLVPLEYRPEIARELGADLFISIHADSGGSYSDVSGASVYTLSNEASSDAAARFASRENDADRVNGISIDGESAEVSAILVELSQARTQEDAAEFASLITREGEGTIAFHPTARRSASLIVLQAPDVPSVLFESGFVTNDTDRARLSTEEGRRQYAEVLAQAIRVYFARRAEPRAEP
ncbi:N-acetylmuramoyl-L-alanine amidase family protein [Erythrobacter ani]|uniref:N-acetylmuramoyl-L-alanine amidase n=1 Tax=Erythrobacter ani TaxID=2827235 RepID=A0ABS6SPI8_9SPHN|nr:N-acetylmuramoyl-L-alanine amidase [Erythrobacter ani]MBV7266956.1 N-acetylmuramoyl-L-alanine amidase [Erythrobacter ani]